MAQAKDYYFYIGEDLDDPSMGMVVITSVEYYNNEGCLDEDLQEEELQQVEGWPGGILEDVGGATFIWNFEDMSLSEMKDLMEQAGFQYNEELLD